MGSLLRRLSFAVLVAAVSVSASCAQERDEINRVQPVAIKKSDLVGDLSKAGTDAPEFYMRSLITEVQRTNPWFSDGLQDLTRRIRFEVTQDYLIARNGYEYIKNTDGRGGPRGRINNGPVVGKWRITSHFDIRKGYNAQTGEVSNVIEENAIDRPWNQREFMRIDWSRNMTDDPNQIFWYDSFGGDLKWSNLSYTESIAAPEDVRSHFNEIHQGYFDLTSRWVAGPQTFDYYGYAFPACFLRNMNLYQGTYNADPSIDCNDQETTLRTSFWKIPVGDQSSDYEVAEVTKWQGNIVGNLTMDRSGYDRNYGIVDDTWHTYIMRYNIWQKSHETTDCGGPNVSRAEASESCAAVKTNSYCDFNAGKCTIPYEERKVRPLAFFLDPALPAVLQPNTQRSIDDWNFAMKSAVSHAREAECRKAAGDFNDLESRAACHAKYFNGDIDITKEDEPSGDPVVVMCHNPVIKGDSTFCGPEGKSVRKGDIREHMITWWNNPSFNRPLGVIVWSGDPISGENIGSTVNIFGASVETYSARARDQVMLVNGDLSPSEYVSGLTQDWYGNEKRSYDNDPIRSPELDAMAKKFSLGAKQPAAASAGANQALKATVKSLSDAKGFTTAMAGATTPPQRLIAYNAYVAKQAAAGAQGFGTTSEHNARLGAQMEKLKKGGFEPKLMSDMWLASQGVDPKFADAPEVKRLVSPLGGMSAPSMAQMDQIELDRQHKMHMCKLEMPEFLSFAWTAGYSAKLKAKYPNGATAEGPLAVAAGVNGQTIDRIIRGKLIYQELLNVMYEDTLLHEIGHLMSMEHVFTGTWDAPNFHPEYWQLRAHGKKDAMKACVAGPDGKPTSGPETCMGPRWLDPVTAQEFGTVKGQEHDSEDSYAVSSVMDYKFDALHGPRLGTFDKMAMKFIYTRMIELVDDERYSLIKAADGKRMTPSNTLMNAENWFAEPGDGGDGGFDLHYTQVARVLNLFDPKRCREQAENEKDGGYGVLGQRCAPPHRDHAFLTDMESALPSGGFPEDFRVQYGKLLKSVSPKTKYRWPYKVSNGQAAYFHGYVYDNGADIYEITQDLLERYELMYLDNFFRKNSRERNVGNAGRAMYGRFFDRVQALQWNTLSSVVRNGGLGGAAETIGQEADNRSLVLLFDAMTRSLLRPQPGGYVENKQPGALFSTYSVPETPTASPVFTLGAGDSRYIDYEFNLEKQFDYRAYAFRSGSYLEKPFAAIALTDARPQLSTVARETYLDGRNVMFSFRNAIPVAFDRLIGGIMADDWDAIAPHVDLADGEEDGIRPIHTLKLWSDNPADLTRPATARIVDPTLGYRVKLETAINMLLFQPIDTNMELVQRTRIWQTGSLQEISVPANERIVFFDPNDGVEWNARTYGTETLAGKLVEKGVGARMMARANEILGAAYNVDMEAVPGGAPGQMRPRYVNGRPVRGGVPVTAGDVKDAAAAAKLRQYVGFMNNVKSLLFYLGFGPCGRGEEC
jgi:hypothetical protein